MECLFRMNWSKLARVRDRNPAFKAFLFPFSLAYHAIVWLRNIAYDSGILKTQQVDAFVVSVGSVFAGGSGKTPAANFLARRLHGRGYRVAVLSRGYGRRFTHDTIVFDGKKLQTDVSLTGDEPLMLAHQYSREQLPICVVAGRDKQRIAEIAIQELGCDALVLDDGLQFRRLRRNVEIVALTESQAVTPGTLLPHGYLRESTSAFRRADLLWIVSNGAAPFTNTQQPNSLPVIRARFEPVHFRSPGAKTAFRLDRFRNEKVTAFSGIADHESFLKTLESTGAIVSKSFDFEDHHSYTKADLERIFSAAGDQKILTTEKDSVRLPEPSAGAKNRIFYLVCRTTITDDKALDQYLAKGSHVGSAE